MKTYQTVKAQLGASAKIRAGIPVEQKKQTPVTKTTAKDAVSKSLQIQGGALKKKQTLRGLMEAHNVIKGTGVKGSQSKRKSVSTSLTQLLTFLAVHRASRSIPPTNRRRPSSPSQVQ